MRRHRRQCGPWSSGAKPLPAPLPASIIDLPPPFPLGSRNKGQIDLDLSANVLHRWWETENASLRVRVPSSACLLLVPVGTQTSVSGKGGKVKRKIVRFCLARTERFQIQIDGGSQASLSLLYGTTSGTLSYVTTSVRAAAFADVRDKITLNHTNSPSLANRRKSLPRARRVPLATRLLSTSPPHPTMPRRTAPAPLHLTPARPLPTTRLPPTGARPGRASPFPPTCPPPPPLPSVVWARPLSRHSSASLLRP